MGYTPLLDDDALRALFLPFDEGVLRWPTSDRLLCLNACDGFALREHWRPAWRAQQDFKPLADGLQRAGIDIRAVATEQRFDCVLLLPPRQRERARALYAQALDHLAPGGALVASIANNAGAKSAEADLTQLLGAVESRSKHKCRVLAATPRDQAIDTGLLADWRAQGTVQTILDGAWWSRPGLFAWDRIDTASALLATHLPADLAGHVADLGAGFGYLAVATLQRCPGVRAIELYEADALALEPARRNLERAIAVRGSGRFAVHWHDVTQGLPQRFDAIVMNPPFHLDRRDQPDLGRAFIERAADALTASGRLLLVANRHLPYEATLKARFHTVTTRADQDGFKVIEARGVRAP
ncbi:MAG TPA: methyltransferase [Rhodanobacteraceae bacterium]|nr:methyltransferase [Rhodanobacteraceae bacterium]